MPELLQTILLGIIEGVTEFLPISSTGHLLIAEHWLGRRSDLFNIAIQAGAILAVVLIFRQRLLELLLRWRKADNRDYLMKLSLAFLITVAGGFAAKSLGLQLPESVLPIALALIVGGVLIFLIEGHVSGKPINSFITWHAAVWVGLSQVLAAVFPGTSRSAATIFAAMLAGVSSRPAAAEFSFLVGIPTMFAATAYEGWRARGRDPAFEDWQAIGLGFVVSALVAFAVVKWLLRYVQTHRFTPFAWYRIGAGLALLWVAQ